MFSDPSLHSVSFRMTEGRRSVRDDKKEHRKIQNKNRRFLDKKPTVSDEENGGLYFKEYLV